MLYVKQGNVKKIQKIDENSWSWRRSSSYLLNNLWNFSEIFRKDVTYDIKSHKKPGLHPLSRRYIFGKTTAPQPFKSLGFWFSISKAKTNIYILYTIYYIYIYIYIYIHTYIRKFKIVRLRFFCRVIDIKIPWINIWQVIFIFMVKAAEMGHRKWFKTHFDSASSISLL